jgi:hypothetical protein
VELDEEDKAFHEKQRACTDSDSPTKPLALASNPAS